MGCGTCILSEHVGGSNTTNAERSAYFIHDAVVSGVWLGPIDRALINVDIRVVV